MISRSLIMLSMVLTLTVFPAAGQAYIVFIDREFGFWAVRSYDINQTISYKSKTLNLSTGDSIDWVNMDSENERVTVVSNEYLWENGTLLGNTGSKFRFTFNSSGIYKFHIIENTRTTINMSNYSRDIATVTYYYYDEDGEEHTVTLQRDANDYRSRLENVVNTETFPYQEMTVKVTGMTVGNGTTPMRPGTSVRSGYSITRGTMSVDARATPRAQSMEVGEPTPTPTPAPIESYQEFTIYEVLKRWYSIITTVNNTSITG